MENNNKKTGKAIESVRSRQGFPFKQNEMKMLD